MLRSALAVLVGSAITLAASAATPTVDSAFVPVFAAPATVRAVAPMPDGRVVVGGDFTTMNGQGTARVARLHADGSLDTSFLLGGGAELLQVQAVAVQPDGKVLVGGQVMRYGETRVRQNLLRFNADGTWDASFDAGGFDYTAGSYGLDAPVQAIALDAAGRILVGGDFSGPRPRIARLTAAGALDATFDPGTGPDAAVTHIALQSTGHIVIGGGFASVAGTPKAGVARLTAAGALDAAAFGTGVAGGGVAALAVQPDDRVLVGGSFSSPAENLARYGADGTLEAAFAPVGVGNLQAVTSLAVAGGRIYVGGWYSFIIFNGNPTDHDARVYVIAQADGGWLTAVSFAGKPTDVLALAPRPDGTVVVGGSFTRRDDPGDSSLAAGLGLLTAAEYPILHASWRPQAGGQAEIRALSLEPDGRIVVGGGFYLANGVARNGVARLNADGTLDATLDTPAIGGGTVTGVVRRSDGRYVMGGNFYDIAGNDYTDVALLSATGAYEAGVYAGMVNALAPYPGDRVLVAMPHTPGVRRISAAFAFEDASTFNPGSGISNEIRPDGELDRVNAVAVQADGKILVGGSFSTFSGAAHANILRLNADGTIDNTFASPGFTVFNFRHEIFAIAVQADGKILVAGRFSTVGGLPRPTVARLNADGSVDAGFVTPFLDQGSTAYALLVQPDGRIVVGGNIQLLVGSDFYNGLVRLNADGSRDASFAARVTGAPRALLAAGGGAQLLVGGTVEVADGMPRAGLARYTTPVAGRRGDANGDGKADLFWREAAPGAGLSWWTMNGNAVTGANYFEVGAEWQVADVGDLDGDGKADLVWRRASDGATYLWTLDGLGFKGFHDLGILDPAQWTLVGSADFNGDARADLLWRRNADGMLYVWLMNAGTIIGQGSPATVDLSWDVADLADMDGDGRADLVWRRAADGAVAVWFMNGASSTGGGTVGVLDPAIWSLYAADDFDGDGKADLLWRSTDGDTWVWLMDGTAFRSGASVGNPGPAWSIRSVGDFDGDGKADLAWRHADGTAYLWKMNGAAVSAYLPLANPGGSWQVVAP